jgi:uncharacterized protein YjiK
MHQIYSKITVALLSASAILFSCSNSNSIEPAQPDLELLSVVSINVSEPSGLCINNDGNALYTVSDSSNKVYKLSMSGTILTTFDFVGDDLEGVSKYENNKLLIAEERNKSIIEFEIDTENYITHEIEYDNNEANSGIEGVTYNPNNNTIYILNEKNPGILMKLNSFFSIQETYELNFANDYSGIFYDETLNTLWIVSDQNKTLNKCNLNGELLKEYSIPAQKAEGVVVTTNKIYIVSDSENKLLTFH